ncbi:MAG: protoporphyrinogen oxidase [Bacteroidota bacterium]|jgi:putative membrane protein|nr:protoporphyrinogen oxidase [Bacteroidota bacterium]
MDEYYGYFKALHIIFVVTWFAGLFYIVRLFIYHTEAEAKAEPEKSILQNQFKIMEKRLWYGITWPSMFLTLVAGGCLLWVNPVFLSQAYFILKLAFVGALIIYHFQCHVFFKQLQNDEVKSTSTKLRIWNEVATIILVAIVFLIVLKSNTGFIWGMLGLVVFAVTLMLAIKLYKKSRERKEKGEESGENGERRMEE